MTGDLIEFNFSVEAAPDDDGYIVVCRKNGVVMKTVGPMADLKKANKLCNEWLDFAHRLKAKYTQ